jgi:hypothetical protein
VLKTYEKPILRVAGLLRSLERDPDDLDTLISIQRELIRLIKRSEARVAHWRKVSQQLKKQLRGGGLTRAEADVVRSRLEGCREKIEGHQYLKFIWKCFGDGVAFIYLDKHALKHTYFRTDVYERKQDSGALLGKTGLEREWEIVKALARRGIPALLCDLTETIRHGDVCILIGPDPASFEVKTSENVNSRVERQVQSLKDLRGFFERDEATNFRGLQHISRHVLEPPEVTHLDALNQCILDSEGKPGLAVSPEQGLHYLCLRNAGGSDDVFQGLINEHSEFCTLNATKTAKCWHAYYPFTLSIRDPRLLYGFIRGDYVLAVVLDRNELKRQLAERGIEVAMPATGDWALWLRNPDPEAVHAVSRHLFGRLFYEFQSLAWFVAAQSSVPGKLEKLHPKGGVRTPIRDITDVGRMGDLPDWARKVVESPNDETEVIDIPKEARDAVAKKNS